MYCCICLCGAGEVFCYVDCDKPPLGQGLNCEAEITLYNVYKVDECVEARDAHSLDGCAWNLGEEIVWCLCVEGNTRV